MPKLLKAQCGACKATIDEHVAVLCPSCVMSIVAERDRMQKQVGLSQSWASIWWHTAKRLEARVAELEKQLEKQNG